jgi:hypothetical protein
LKWRDIRLVATIQLDFTKPASVGQQHRFLCRASELIGMLRPPVTHDIRRGAAADIFELPVAGGDTNRVRRALGHSMKAMNEGITDEYIGRSKGDSWAERLDSTADAASAFGVQTAQTSFKRRKVETRDIDTYCDNNSLDKKSRNDRAAARVKLVETQRQQWSAH